MKRRTFVSGLLAASVVASGIASSQSPARAATVFNGTAPARAAASCWEIKQLFPSSPDGIYWLLTAKLKAPAQFYCDMTTDGGGWVLVGRGREDWTYGPNGQRSANSVRNPVTGPAAFPPAALNTSTIDGLLNGQAPAALADGVRVKRAADLAGTITQEIRIDLKDLQTWSWAFGGGHRIDGVSFDSTVYAGLSPTATTRDLQNLSSSDLHRMSSFPESRHAFKGGWSYGSSIRGNSLSTSYLWEKATEGYAVPFTQVWLRPMLNQANAGFVSIPDTGLALDERRALPNNRPVNFTWGLSGLNQGIGINDLAALATSFAEFGDRMIIGGKFTTLQNGAAGTPITQSYLAAFNRTTGEWIPDFLPQLNGVVWALRMTPEGRLIVGGEFTTVNGQPRTGLVALDPATGAVDPTWTGSVLTIGGDNIAWVKSLDVQGNWLYVGGKFAQVIGQSPFRQYSANRLGRFALSSGQPDLAWRPRVNATVYDLDASAQGDRVWIAGYFTTVNSVYRKRVAAINTTDGAEIPGIAPFQHSWNDVRDFQQTIIEDGNFTYIGGSEHDLQKTSRSDMTLLRAHQTLSGGDFQATGIQDGVLFASCHCAGYRTWSFSDTNKHPWSSPGNAMFSRSDPINFIGAWDKLSFDAIPEFNPDLGSIYGTGAWEFYTDSDNCLWIGGDVKAGRDIQTTQWLSGFSKHCPRDATAPSKPNATWARTSTRTVKLDWSASTDNAGGIVSYEILNEDRVIATTTNLTYTAYPVDGPARFFVRAIDASGNRSATTAILGEGITAKPVATINIACNDLTCQFDGSASVDADGAIVSYVWDAGDGSAALAGAVVDHVFAADGTYVVTLTVTDDDGASDSEQIEVIVSVVPNVGPTAAATVSCDQLQCSFDGSGSTDTDGSIASYSWDAGDGSAAIAGVGAAHSFAADGTYVITLTVIDNEGATATDTATISVVDDLDPTALASVTCVGQTCQYDASLSTDPEGSPLAYAWDFGDGATDAAASGNHVYASSGTFTVTLTVTDAVGQTHSVTATAVIAPIVSELMQEIDCPIADRSTNDCLLAGPSSTSPITKIEVGVRLNHSYDSDLDISLVHPSGASVELTSDNGGSSNNYGSGNANPCDATTVFTVFDDAASSSVSSASAPFAASYRPEDVLSALNGLAANGTWKLRVVDDSNDDTGVVLCWFLKITH